MAAGTPWQTGILLLMIYMVGLRPATAKKNSSTTLPGLKMQLTYDPLFQNQLMQRVPIYDCSNPTTSSATLLNPTSCSQTHQAADEVHTGSLLYLPGLEQQEMKVRKVTFSITGKVCRRWSITYPNIQHFEAVKLTKAHCQSLHRLDQTTLDEIPIRQETSSGAFTSLTITPKCIGMNIIKIRFGSIHSGGACTGQ